MNALSLVVVHTRIIFLTSSSVNNSSGSFPPLDFLDLIHVTHSGYCPLLRNLKNSFVTVFDNSSVLQPTILPSSFFMLPNSVIKSSLVTSLNGMFRFFVIYYKHLR